MSQCTAPANASSCELSRFPVHQIVVFKSEFFEAQVENWQGNSSTSSGPNTRRGSSRGNAAACAAQRPTLELTIDSAEQLPAAEAVIAAMYGVDNALGSLEQPQLVHAVMVADRVQVAVATQQAVQALLAAARSDEGLSAAALDSLASLYPWPSCLLPLLPAIVAGARCCNGSAADLPAIQAADVGSRVQCMLAAVLGDLEAVWGEQQLQELLLQLPLPAMQLLLSSDQLRVVNEDAVLYTARQYTATQHVSADKAAAKAALAPLVRCPHLSRFALLCEALPTNHQQLLLSSFNGQLRQLLSLKHVAPAGDLPSELLNKLQNAPNSWQLGQRQIKASGDGVRVVWRLPVQQLEQACRDSFVQRKAEWVYGPKSPPLGGLAWRMAWCVQQGGKSGSELGMYVGPDSVPADVFYKFESSITYNGIRRSVLVPGCLVNGGYRGYQDFFGLGPMAGGWDAAAWAAKGLPTSGEVEVELHVHSVC